MIQKVNSKEFAILLACPAGVSWGESETDHCIYVGDIQSLRTAGVKIGVEFSDDKPPKVTEKLRRYQIILPEYGNDGCLFDCGLRRETIRELLDEFGGFTLEDDILGAWVDENEKPKMEKNVRLICDVPDTHNNKVFFMHFRETCQARFNQEEIWLTSFPIERVI